MPDNTASTPFEVDEPILNSPYKIPGRHWYLRQGEAPVKREGRRPSIVFLPADQDEPWDTGKGILTPARDYTNAYELALVNRVRERVQAWRDEGWPGATRTTLELLEHWTRPDRDMKHRLFFAQCEAVEAVIFLVEAREDFRQGIAVPMDEPGPEKVAQGCRAFLRYACKMATGSGKTTVMGMLTAWSILNKVNDRSDGRFSDVALIVCPNVTIRDRLAELDPQRCEASLYRTRDLVPKHFMPALAQGRVLVTNWHVFERQTLQTGGVSARVSKRGKPEQIEEWVILGDKTTTARGKRYQTPGDFEKELLSGRVEIVQEERNEDGSLKRARIRYTEYFESDTAWLQRVLGDAAGKQNILVMNDEAHHAYRIRPTTSAEDEDEEEDDDYDVQEATVWVDGLDRIHRHRGINFCMDLSATPYFLNRVNRDAIRPDTSAGEAPELPVLEANRAEGSTREVDGETSRDVRDVNKSHVNRVVLDTKQWEQSAAYHLDTHPKVESFVKNWRLGFGILYLADEKMRTYEPDFIVRCVGRPNAHLILETKMARDDHKDAKRAAALRWCAAVTASGKFGVWRYEMVSRPEDVRAAVERFAAES